MSLREKVDALFFNLGHIQNLRRRFYTYLDSAPTKFAGLIGFIIFFIRLGWYKFTGKSKEQTERETDISVLFAEAVVRD
jgi:hypothetical protein